MDRKTQTCANSKILVIKLDTIKHVCTHLKQD